MELCSPISSDNELEKRYSEFRVVPDVIDEVPSQLMIGKSKNLTQKVSYMIATGSVNFKWGVGTMKTFPICE